MQVAGTPSTAMTVYPPKLAQALLDQAHKLVGTSVLNATVCGLQTTSSNKASPSPSPGATVTASPALRRVTGVVLQPKADAKSDMASEQPPTKVIKAATVIMALGPWSQAAASKWVGDTVPVNPDQKWQSCELRNSDKVQRQETRSCLVTYQFGYHHTFDKSAGLGADEVGSAFEMLQACAFALKRNRVLVQMSPAMLLSDVKGDGRQPTREYTLIARSPHTLYTCCQDFTASKGLPAKAEDICASESLTMQMQGDTAGALSGRPQCAQHAARNTSRMGEAAFKLQGTIDGLPILVKQSVDLLR